MGERDDYVRALDRIAELAAEVRRLRAREAEHPAAARHHGVDAWRVVARLRNGRAELLSWARERCAHEGEADGSDSEHHWWSGYRCGMAEAAKRIALCIDEDDPEHPPADDATGGE